MVTIASVAGCSDSSGGASAARQVCEAASSAQQRLLQEGYTQAVHNEVGQLVEAAQQLSSGHETLLYWVSYVGDTYRGSYPQGTVPPTLGDLVGYCTQD